MRTIAFCQLKSIYDDVDALFCLGDSDRPSLRRRIERHLISLSDSFGLEDVDSINLVDWRALLLSLASLLASVLFLLFCLSILNMSLDSVEPRFTLLKALCFRAIWYLDGESISHGRNRDRGVSILRLGYPVELIRQHLADVLRRALGVLEESLLST